MHNCRYSALAEEPCIRAEHAPIMRGSSATFASRDLAGATRPRSYPKSRFGGARQPTRATARRRAPVRHHELIGMLTTRHRHTAHRPRPRAMRVLVVAVAHRYLHALFGGSNPRVLVRALRYAEPSSDALSYVEFQADRAFAVRDAGRQAMGRPNAGP